MNILEKLTFQPSLDFKKEFLAKDFSYKRLIALRPEYKETIDFLITLIEKKKYLSIDLQEKILDIGDSTCKRAIWHVDGINNNYIIVCWGDFRTLFMKKLLPFDRQENIPKTSDYIHNLYKNIPPENYFEAPNGTPIIYTSDNIHSGQIATHPSKRILLRLCYSDYILPNNVLMKSYK